MTDISFADESVVKQLTAKLEEYDLLRTSENMAKSEYELLKTRREHMEETLYAEMEDAGLTAVKTAVGTFYLRTDIYCSIKKEVQEEAFNWLRQLELDDIIQPTVNSRTLSAIMKEQLEAGNTIPDFVNVTTKNRVGIRH